MTDTISKITVLEITSDHEEYSKICSDPNNIIEDNTTYCPPGTDPIVVIKYKVKKPAKIAEFPCPIL